jgi:hypothetical protein
MIQYDPRPWHHRLADHLQIPPGVALQLLRLGTLPDASVRDRSRQYCRDLEALKAIERCRRYFDTPLLPFVTDLRLLVADLKAGRHEPRRTRALVQFQQFGLGDVPEAPRFYPVTVRAQPWRGHRVAALRSELDAAGYGELAKLWSLSSSAYGYVRTGGQAPLGSLQWVTDCGKPWLREKGKSWERPRFEFLGRLADVLQRRSSDKELLS